jgi:transcriptional regulator with XRE-family HTH domain
MFKGLNNPTMPPKHPQFAAFVTGHREALGLSQSQLAEQVGVHRSNVNYWESGQGLPVPTALESLARALRVSYEDLFALAGYTHPEGLPGPAIYTRTLFPRVSKTRLAEAKRLFEKIDEEEKRPRKRSQGRRR